MLAFVFGIDINAAVAGSLGRDPTLTGRSTIWNAVLSTQTNPLLGTGYESFWLGDRLIKVWRQTGPGINEAHNGYLEIYLNQGIIGLLLLGVFLMSSYYIVWRQVGMASSVGALSLALWTILPFYNVTESAFRGQLLWVIFLLGAVVVPARKNRRSQGALRDKSSSALNAFRHQAVEPAWAKPTSVE
jgi:O-antigen ligase